MSRFLRDFTAAVKLASAHYFPSVLPAQIFVRQKINKQLNGNGDNECESEGAEIKCT